MNNISPYSNSFNQIFSHPIKAPPPEINDQKANLSNDSGVEKKQPRFNSSNRNISIRRNEFNKATQPKKPPLIVSAKTPAKPNNTTPSQTLSFSKQTSIHLAYPQLSPQTEKPFPLALKKEPTLNPPLHPQSPPSTQTLSYVERAKRNLANPPVSSQTQEPFFYKKAPNQTPRSQLQSSAPQKIDSYLPDSLLSPPSQPESSSLIGFNHSAQLTPPQTLSEVAQKIDSSLPAPLLSPPTHPGASSLIGSNHLEQTIGTTSLVLSKEVPSNLANLQLSYPLEAQNSSENQSHVLNIGDALRDLYTNKANRFFQNIINDIPNPSLRQFVNATVQNALTAVREGICTSQEISQRVREQLESELSNSLQEAKILESKIPEIDKETLKTVQEKQKIHEILISSKYIKNREELKEELYLKNKKIDRCHKEKRKIIEEKRELINKTRELEFLIRKSKEFKCTEDDHKEYIKREKRNENYLHFDIKKQTIQGNDVIDSKNDLSISNNPQTDGFEITLNREKHTIPIEQYLEVRVPEFVRDAIRIIGKVVIFVGPDEQLSSFCENFNYEIPVELNAKSSSQYLMVQNKESKAVDSILVCGIGSKARLLHTVLQLRYAGVESSQISVIGNIELNILLSISNMGDRLDKFLGSSPIDLFFMGGQAQVMFTLCKKICGFIPNNTLKNNRFEAARSLLQRSGKVRIESLQAGTIRATCFRVAKSVIIAFRIPNGDLAGHVVTGVLQRNVVNLIMIGAGKTLRDDAQIGAYQTFSEARLDGTEQTIHTDQLNTLPFPPSLSKDFEVIQGGATSTVGSPLVEDFSWLENAMLKKIESVDVECFPIVEAIQHTNAQTKVLTGLFISDTPTRPLTGKIGKEAYKDCDLLVEAFLEPILEPLEREDSKKTAPRPNWNRGEKK